MNLSGKLLDIGGLCEQAAFNPPLNSAVLNTASSFAEWIFLLQHEGRNERVSEKDKNVRKDFGKDAEVSVQQTFLELAKRGKKFVERDWELVFYDPVIRPCNPFLASSLQINGEPFRCKPDLVIRNVKSGEVAIIERKSTRVPIKHIPAIGWPNLWAQLWCYGWIDDWLDAPNMILIGEIIINKNYYGHTKYESIKEIPIFNRADPVYHEKMLKLFRLYGGHFFERVSTS